MRRRSAQPTKPERRGCRANCAGPDLAMTRLAGSGAGSPDSGRVAGLGLRAAFAQSGRDIQGSIKQVSKLTSVPNTVGRPGVNVGIPLGSATVAAGAVSRFGTGVGQGRTVTLVWRLRSG